MFPNWSNLPLQEYRANRIANYLPKFVASGETVLDCGCGSLLIGKALQKLSGVKVYGTDVINLNCTDLNICLCPGERLALANNSVSVVCLIFVLHHTEDPLETVRECLRVAQRRIIIIEDVYQSSLELVLLKLLDWMGNRSVSAEMSIPFNFKSENEWKDIFETFDVELVAVESVRPLPWRPSRHKLFVLEKR